MAHSIGLRIDHELPVSNVDIKIVVTRDGERLGVVTVSRGSIDWKPGKAKRTWSLTWQQFDDLMRESGHAPRERGGTSPRTSLDDDSLPRLELLPPVCRGLGRHVEHARPV